ncbi:hypothetical protein K7432_016991 [Basidiobolus ranarum]|uniref:Uncharacterized protein n=1 Tax=Basidiobolus ranarum TaxID=34480 RepID=A0ABR2WDZ9_9FUNG
MLVELASSKTKFLNKYFQSTIQGRRFVTDGPLHMTKLTIEDLTTLSRECVSSDFLRSNRSVIEEVLDDFQLESYITDAHSKSEESIASSCEDIKDDFIDYVTSLRPKPTILNTPTKTNLRAISYPGPSASKLATKPDFRKTQSLQSVVSHASTSSSATDSDYSMPVTDDEEATPTRIHPKAETVYVLSTDKGKMPEPHASIARRLSFTAPEKSSPMIVSPLQPVICYHT